MASKDIEVLKNKLKQAKALQRQARSEMTLTDEQAKALAKLIKKLLNQSLH